MSAEIAAAIEEELLKIEISEAIDNMVDDFEITVEMEECDSITPVKPERRDFWKFIIEKARIWRGR